ncbi:MAG: hypothetical protein COB85_08855 [Bacteroidetes bacterium]|nr:MAG: hypothetical protein COB85_08855 [Bacteroidota bacterium]
MELNDLKKIAELALEKYEIESVAMDFLTEETNVFFKVIDSNNNVYALKIYQEESSTLDDNQAELFLLDAVKKNSDLFVPEVFLDNSGKGIVNVQLDAGSSKKRVALFKWIEGIDFFGNETIKHFQGLGKMLAKLHMATLDIVIPKNINPKKWDKVFYYRGEKSVYKQNEFRSIISAEYINTMDFIIPYLNERLANFYRKDNPQLLHADLNPWNIKLHENELRLLDYEEALLGYPIHDFAIMLYYYRDSKQFRYNDIKKSLFSGYSIVCTVPTFSNFDLELLMTARRVNFLNYVLTQDGNSKKYIEINLPKVTTFMKKYFSA